MSGDDKVSSQVSDILSGDAGTTRATGATVSDQRSDTGDTPFRRFASAFMESSIATVALLVLLVIIALAVLAPWKIGRAHV